MQGVCMAVMVLMAGTDIETPHILCRLVESSTRVLLVEDQLSDKYRRDRCRSAVRAQIRRTRV